MPTTAADLAAAFRDGLPLETDRLVLRAPSMVDAARMTGLAGDWEVAKYTANIPHPYPDGEAERWLRGAMTSLRTPSGSVAVAIAIKPDPRLAGIVSVTLDRSCRSAELGFWLGQPYWGKGFASEAIGRLAAFLRQRVKLAELHASALPANRGSVGVLKACGFQYDDMVSQEMPARGETAMLERYVLAFGGEERLSVGAARGGGRRIQPVRREAGDLMSVADLMAGAGSGSGFTSMPSARVTGQGGKTSARATRPMPRGQKPSKPAAPAYAVTVVVAVALVDPEGRVLMAQRPEGKPMAGLWEFPGGKMNPGETPEAALIRELKEELDIDVTASCLAPLTFASHGYPDFHLLMPLYVCRVWEGDPSPKEGQDLAWVRPTAMANLEMPEADKPLIAMLRDLL